MRTIYIDFEYKCHTANDGTMTPVETDFFDGKCDTFVEGYRFIPSGESWTWKDGVVFHGEMISPWKDVTELEEAQKRYEEAAREERIAALEEENAMLLECVLEMSEIVYA